MASHTEEIKRWLLSFGRHAEVLEPNTLRAEIHEEARLIQANYEHPTKKRPTSPGSKRQKQS